VAGAVDCCLLGIDAGREYLRLADIVFKGVLALSKASTDG